MKFFLSVILFVSFCFGNDYYAKIEPIYTYNVKSAVSGKVIYINNDIKSKIAKKSDLIVHIDDKINKIELKKNINKLKSLKEILKLQKNLLKSYQSIRSKSQLEKDKQKIVILNTQVSINDLEVKIDSIKYNIDNKNLKSKNLYISNIYVQKDDFVNFGTLLYTAEDLSKGKVELFVSFDDIKSIKNKTIYIDDIKTDVKISKIYTTADIKHISSYKVEIIILTVKQFSKVVKISFK